MKKREERPLFRQIRDNTSKTLLNRSRVKKLPEDRSITQPEVLVLVLR